MDTTAMDTNTVIDADQLHEMYRFAITLGRDAGSMLLTALSVRRDGGHLANGDHEPLIKENATDIVTKTDCDVEHFIHNKISSAYPRHAFLGEESYSKGSSRAYMIDPEVPTWVVDPLDGTVNFTHAFPMFCVSISLVLHNKPLIGVIYAPLMSQLFSACRGRGAWLNEVVRLPYLGNAIGPIPEEAPSKCVFGCEWGKDRKDSPEGNLHKKVEGFVNMAAERQGRGGRGGMVHGIRSLGSAALDLAYVAMGGIDIWHEAGCWEWDVAAGICLVEEAGGLVTTANPPEDVEHAEIRDAHLGGRLYLAIRPAVDSVKETARQGQERAVREVWKRVAHLGYVRPGVRVETQV